MNKLEQVSNDGHQMSQTGWQGWGSYVPCLEVGQGQGEWGWGGGGGLVGCPVYWDPMHHG